MLGPLSADDDAADHAEQIVRLAEVVVDTFPGERVLVLYPVHEPKKARVPRVRRLRNAQRDVSTQQLAVVRVERRARVEVPHVQPDHAGSGLDAEAHRVELKVAAVGSQPHNPRRQTAGVLIKVAFLAQGRTLPS